MNDASETNPPVAESSDRSLRSKVITGLAVAVIVVVGITVSAQLLQTSPRVARRAPERLARLVNVQTARLGPHATVVEAMGTVRAAHRLELRPQVSGRVVEMSSELIPGGRFAAGEKVLQIETRDFELVVEQRSSDLTEAESALALEEGSQDVARRELEILGAVAPGAGSDELVLRQPQLRTAKARVARARAALGAAQLNLERATVRAPFPAVVEQRNAEVGAQVDSNTVLGSLVGSEEYWIEAAVPTDALHWVSVPGAEVRIYNEASWGRDRSRAGRVIRVYNELESEGRMARLLVSVPKPLADIGDGEKSEARLFLGAYVRLEIAGRTLDNVAAIDRQVLRGDSTVWIMTDDDLLELRQVSVVFRGPDQVLVSKGLAEGERLVISELATPVAGMPLRIAEEENLG